MSRKHIRLYGTLLVAFALVSVLIVACGRSGTGQGSAGSATATSTGSTPGAKCAQGTVHTLATTFQETCVDVGKGESLTVVPVAQSLHILTNGSWVKNTPQPSKEPGAPTVANVRVTNSPVHIGPFPMAGTFHIYCTVHPGMNLTVHVT